ncbi:NACHT domain-containing protein [Nonomuraea sp. PA05]|uniref:NACHT domain-containing protein n=1 Tax=Nonomuraea sp. PA05 TaxID=2604466 RepID=UPI0011D7B2A9|nr:NACHT domain-containing protein [Nonomuraea sp. PA05]TYB61356.1 NACHT domain-containing protein [Nonomuraea sp. PA05]
MTKQSVSQGVAPGITQLVATVGSVIALAGGLRGLLSWWHECRAPACAPTSAGIDTAKDILAGLVAEQWREETVLRSLGDPEPMPLPWRATGRRELVDHPEIIAKGAVAFPGLPMHIRDMASGFRALPCRRLVILGGPGTGKTTLAVQLVLELLRTREPGERVPVLVSAARWDERAHPRMQDWLASFLAMDYPALRADALGPGIPEALAARGELLPVIDGLDELPEHARTDMLRALNRSMCENDQLILTCRTEQFAESVDELGDVLTAAAVIEPQPIDAVAAAGYLAACLPPVPRPAWSEVLESLRTGAAPALAQVTSTSLGLWLVRVTYIATRADPAPLLAYGRGSAAELHDHLCDELIPALVSTRPPANGTAQPFRPQHAWTPEQVDRWLTYLCRELSASEADTRDLAWWHLARYTRNWPVRWWSGIAVGAVACVVYTVLGGTPAVGAASGVLVMLVIVLATGSWFRETPGHVDFHLRRGLFNLVRVLPAGILVGALGAGIGWLTATPFQGPEIGMKAATEVGLLSGIGFVVVQGLIRWVERPATDASARSPRSTWRADRNLTAIRIGSGLAVGVIGAFIAWGFKFNPVASLVGGLVGLLFGLMLGSHHAWLAYNLTVPRLATRGSLPLRAMDFLDDAHRLGLLRTEGPYYQFRHVELQQHLARELAEKKSRHREPVPLS